MQKRFPSTFHEISKSSTRVRDRNKNAFDRSSTRLSSWLSCEFSWNFFN